MTLFGGVELGGTKCIAVVGRVGQIADSLEVPTGDPDGTLRALADWLAARGPAATGVASFGPVILDRADSAYGRIAGAPKPGWDGTDVLAPFRELAAPIALDTDVAAAGLAEAALGAARGAERALYVTVGTGIGGAWVRGGEVFHGAHHPELGHLMLRRAPGDVFPGICPFHADCAEGLASGPAIAARAGADPKSLGDDHPALRAAAGVLGALLASLLRALPVDAVVLGGGVITGRTRFLADIADALDRELAGYPPGLHARALLRAAHLGRDAGPAGALLLAARARA